MSTAVRTDSRLIPELTGIRFFLAIFVVIYHYGQPIFFHSPAIVRNVFASGYASVSMFFALSGYVLARSYVVTGRKQRVKFWIARVARIEPAYLTAIAVTLPYYAYAASLGNMPQVTALTIFTALTCTHAWFISSMHLWNFPAWSLSCEYFFYALFPFLIGPIARLDRTRLRRAIVSFAALSLLVPAVYLVWQPDGVPFSGLLQRNITQYPMSGEAQKLIRLGAYRLFMYNPIAHLPVFLVGVALGRYKVAFAGEKITAASRAGVHFSLLAIAVILAVSGWMPHLLLHDSLIALAFCGFILHIEALWGPLSRFLASPAAVLLGEASYALYILQFPLEPWYSAAIRHVHLAISAEWNLIGLLTFLCTASVLTFLYIERPARAWIRARFIRS